MSFSKKIKPRPWYKTWYYEVPALNRIIRAWEYYFFMRRIKNFQFPRIKAVSPKLNTDQFVSLQPMIEPREPSVFKLKYKYIPHRQKSLFKKISIQLQWSYRQFLRRI